MNQPKSDGFCNGDCDSDDNIILDPFGFGNLMDEHMDIIASEEEVIKRFSDAATYAVMMGGTVPGNMLEELGLLVAPIIRWEDIVSNWVVKTKRGSGKNDWSMPKFRPLFAGIYMPTKKSVDVNILFAYDCSGSMGNDDIGFVVSQLGAIGKRECEVSCVAFDTVPHWDKMVKLKKFDKESLATLKAHGRGGTVVNQVLNDYEKQIGKMDIVIIGTDGYLSDQELKDVRVNKHTKYLWLIVGNNRGFKPSFGRVHYLDNGK